MEYILWRYRNLSAIVHTTWRRPKHGGDQKLAGHPGNICVTVGKKSFSRLMSDSCLIPEVGVSTFNVCVGFVG